MANTINECPYHCKMKEEFKEMKRDIRDNCDEMRKSSFQPWMRGLVIMLFVTLFAIYAKLQVDLSREYIPRNEARSDMAEIKSELSRLNNKIDQIIQAQIGYQNGRSSR